MNPESKASISIKVKHLVALVLLLFLMATELIILCPRAAKATGNTQPNKDLFINNGYKSQTEAVRLQSMYYKLPGKVQQYFTDNNIKIEFTRAWPLGTADDGKMIGNEFCFNSTSKCLSVLLFDTSTKLCNTWYVNDLNGYEFMRAVALVYNTDFNNSYRAVPCLPFFIKNKASYTPASQENTLYSGTEAFKDIVNRGYSANKAIYQGVNIQRAGCWAARVLRTKDEYFQMDFALYFMNDYTNGVLKKQDTDAYTFIRSIT